jgi:hypothetical protein
MTATMSKRSDWYKERTTAEALDAVRAKARVEGRAPTLAEYTAVIKGVGEPPKRKRQKREHFDSRPLEFSMWLDYGVIGDDHSLQDIREAPGGFDPVFLALKAIEEGYFTEDDCREAIKKLRESTAERIALIESVLAEVENQKARKASRSPERR